MEGNVLVNRRYDGEALRLARQSNKLTLEQAAEKTGLSFVTVHRIENGCNTTEDTINLLCRLYGIPTDSILC